MSGRPPARPPATGLAALALAVWAASVMGAAAQELVTITVPAAVSFAVTDVTRSTSGAPAVTTITFSGAILLPFRTLRVSVQAGAAGFTPPEGPSIPATNVSWTTSGASGGTGSNGTLSASGFVAVFQSLPLALFGQVDMSWALAAPGAGIRAGNHQLTIRWKVESISP